MRVAVQELNQITFHRDPLILEVRRSERMVSVNAGRKGACQQQDKQLVFHALRVTSSSRKIQ
jgi:hypothetical protein